MTFTQGMSAFEVHFSTLVCVCVCVILHAVCILAVHLSVFLSVSPFLCSVELPGIPTRQRVVDILLEVMLGKHQQQPFSVSHTVYCLPSLSTLSLHPLLSLSNLLSSHPSSLSLSQYLLLLFSRSCHKLGLSLYFWQGKEQSTAVPLKLMNIYTTRSFTYAYIHTHTFPLNSSSL